MLIIELIGLYRLQYQIIVKIKVRIINYTSSVDVYGHWLATVHVTEIGK